MGQGQVGLDVSERRVGDGELTVFAIFRHHSDDVWWSGEMERRGLFSFFY
tara:strand:- start:13 stop:162 length:150 start_codon:yes stop_codon:yes gene_type:complete